MDEDYSPSPLAITLHGLPHLSFKFVLLTNKTFTFDTPEYLESLAVIALMPVVLLVLTMLGFLIYYCCVGMRRTAPNKRNNSTSCYCSVCLMVVFVMLALGAICVAIYGSIQVHEGVASASDSTSDINQSFSKVTKEVKDINILMDELEILAQDLVRDLTNNSDAKALLSSVESLLSTSNSLPNQNEGADDRLQWTIEVFKLTEFYRTLVTFSLIGFQGMVCLLALMGVCFRSKGLLIATTFIGLLCLVTSYLYLGSLLLVDVAVGDLCMDPYTYIKQQSVEKLYMDNATAVYYLKCSHEINALDPYKKGIEETDEALGNVNQAITNFGVKNEKLPESADNTLDILHDKTYELDTVLKSLARHLNCRKVHAALKDFVPAVCDLTLEGLFILGVAVLSVCCALTAVLCAAPKSWKRFAKTARTPDELDLDDVFLPPATNRSTISRTNNPLYNPPEDGYSRRISSNTNPPVAASNSLSFFRRSEEAVNLLEDQPPPEYSPPRSGSNY